MTQARLHYPMARHRLDNGLEVVVAPDADAPGVAVNIWVEVGSADETPGRTGFAHLFEHLMFQGSANVASGEHMATVEALGGTVNATTSTDRTNYFETVPHGALDLALWLEADRFSSLAITGENFETQRQVVKEEKRQRYDNQPYGDLLELLTGQHFPSDHPYGHLTIGSMQDLDDAPLEDVATFFGAWYPASNLRLVLCGPVGADEGIALAEKHFGHLPMVPKPMRAAMPEPTAATPGTTTVSRPVPHSLSYLSWGRRWHHRLRSRRSTSPSPCWRTAAHRACTGPWCASATSPMRCTARCCPTARRARSRRSSGGPPTACRSNDWTRQSSPRCPASSRRAPRRRNSPAPRHSTSATGCGIWPRRRGGPTPSTRPGSCTATRSGSTRTWPTCSP
nr:pitrilysin family protein [Tessaracoccus coleopterorum]